MTYNYDIEKYDEYYDDDDIHDIDEEKERKKFEKTTGNKYLLNKQDLKKIDVPLINFWYRRIKKSIEEEYGIE